MMPSERITSLPRALVLVAILAAAPSARAQNKFIHIVPMIPPGRKAPAPLAPPHLIYYGGPVASHVVAVSVLWGTSVNSQVAAAMPAFLSDITSSTYMDWLCEYNTLGLGGTTTDQVIGRGSYGGQYTITPSTSATSLTDAQIQNEISVQLAGGHLPPPLYDGQGYPETLYVIEFPHGTSISSNGGSCVTFCAYHGTMVYNGKLLMYAVHPDFGAGSGCDVGCGSGTMIQNQESAHTHELIETVTDPEVGFATVYGPPLAWYDSTSGEIGDICNGAEVPLTVNGHSYTVQTEWSNVQNNCVAGNPGLFAGPTISGTNSACEGGTISLTASGGTAPFEWLLDPGTGAQILPGQSGATLTISPATPSNGGNYYASSEGTCTTLSAAWPVTVNPLPNAAITTASSACGSSSGNTASVLASSGATYAWSAANGTVDVGQGTSSISFSTGASGSTGLSVTVTPPSGCASTGLATVSLTTPPPDVGASFLVSEPSGNIQWSWQAVVGATSYEVWRSIGGPAGPFSALVGTATGGQTSLALPVGSEPASADYLVEALFNGCPGPLN